VYLVTGMSHVLTSARS